MLRIHCDCRTTRSLHWTHSFDNPHHHHGRPAHLSIVGQVGGALMCFFAHMHVAIQYFIYGVRALGVLTPSTSVLLWVCSVSHNIPYVILTFYPSGISSSIHVCVCIVAPKIIHVHKILVYVNVVCKLYCLLAIGECMHVKQAGCDHLPG